MVQATFDPADPAQSYQVLHIGVLHKMQDWLQEQVGYAKRFQDEFQYLAQERGIEVGDEFNLAQRVLYDLEQAIAQLNQELVTDLSRFQPYCDELKQAQERLCAVQQKLVSKRTAKEPPTDEEKPLLEALTSQRRSLEDIRRQLPAGVRLEDLFKYLKSLYRKGHIELEVRRRE
jgi:chromosome segregation ATPase